MLVPSSKEGLTDARRDVEPGRNYRERARRCAHLPAFSKVPEIRKHLDPFVRGSQGYSPVDRGKLMKPLWDAIGTEFGGRHELCERKYFGNHKSIRFEVLMVGLLNTYGCIRP